MIAALIALALTPPAADELPRYRLTPGRVLTYKGESSSGEGLDREASEWTAWALKANPDGSTRLLMRDARAPAPRNAKVKPLEPPPAHFAYADVFPDGRILPNPSIRYRGRPDWLLARLPKDAAEAKAGWEHADGDRTLTAKPLGGGQFAVRVVGAQDKVYGLTRTVTYAFDPARGLITKAVVEGSEARQGKYTATTELASEKQLPAADVAALAADADLAFAATAAHEAAFAPAQKLAPEQAKAALARALDALKRAEAKVTRPELKGVLAEAVQGHDESARSTLDSAARRAAVVGKPAAAFDAVDMNGKPVDLADLKGQVVVVDFWYRGCFWCVKAMPQVNQLAEDFAGQPVAVLGLNTDAVKADAEAVIKELALKYPTWRVKHEVAKDFGVQGFPTLVLIDKKGVVRDLHVGFSPTLREEVGKAVKELLAEK